MDWHDPPTDFKFILFDRPAPSENAYRFYYIGWQPTLFNERAVVCLWGRKGESQRSRMLHFASLDEAWPLSVPRSAGASDMDTELSRRTYSLLIGSHLAVVPETLTSRLSLTNTVCRSSPLKCW